MDTDLRLFFDLSVIALLLFANGFFVASEFAIVKIRKTRIIQLSNEGSKSAKCVLDSIEHMDNALAAIQLGITIASIGLGWVGEGTIVKIIDPIFKSLPSSVQHIATHSLAVTISFALVTLLHVVVGELMPKSIAIQDPEKTSLIIAKPMYAIRRIFMPFTWVLNGFGNLFLKLIKVEPANDSRAHSVEEIDMIIDASHKEGILNDTEKDILQNVFKFSDTMAKQVMVPRPDVVAIDINSTPDEIKTLILENQYTRYPVYEDELDHIIGVLHIKDMYPLICANKIIEIKNILREPMLVPETMTIDNLVLEFKSKKTQIAFVMDEFGSVSGIATLEDVLEEIFGEVQDEFDEEEEAEIKQLSEDEFIANAMMRIDEFNEFFDTKIEDEDIETIGGLVVKHLGKIAEQEDVVDIENFTFKVIEIDGARIVKIKIKRNPKEVVEE